MPEPAYTVVIADVQGSRSRADVRPTLDRQLPRLSRDHCASGRILLPYAVTAGDEFQTISAALDQIPRLILDVRRTLRPLVLRVGVGFGRIAGRVKAPVNQMTGEAFVRARSALESLKGVRRRESRGLTAYRTGDEAFDITVNLIYELHDALLADVSPKQWDTIETYQKRGSIAVTARVLKLNISTVSRNLRRAHFWQFEQTADTMKEILSPRLERIAR
jgi:hypothetical protein